MPNRTEARPAKAALTNATGRLPLLRLFSTPLIERQLSNRNGLFPLRIQAFRLRTPTCNVLLMLSFGHASVPFSGGML